MAIKVQSANNTIRVGVSTGGSTGGVQATYDPTEYYSNLARDWAIKMDGKVQEQDYSSKYYAQDSKNSAMLAVDIVTDFDDHVQQVENDFNINAQNKIDEATIWAEGTDEQVQVLGGEHSAKGWAELGGLDIEDATTDTKGIIQIATEQEADEGLSTDKAMTPALVSKEISDNVGRGIVLGFDGILENNVLTFAPADGVAYDLKNNYDYEIDLHFPAVGLLPDDTDVRIINGMDEIAIRNVLSGSTNATYGDLRQVCDYIEDIGWRWIFTARYKSVNSDRAFVMQATTVALQQTLKNASEHTVPSTKAVFDALEEKGSGLNLFDVLEKDHVLSFAESNGLALLGTYVYKNAVSGSRYGYPTFYNKCVEEYNASSEGPVIANHVRINGTVPINNGITGSFTSSGYITLPEYFVPGSNPWEFVTKITTGDLSVINGIIGSSAAYKAGVGAYINTNGLVGMALTSNGSSWDIFSTTFGTSVLLANTEYYFKIEFTGSAYNLYYSTNGVDWILEITVASSTAIYQGSYYWYLCSGYIGGTTWYSNITNLDLKETYININGERWWSGTTNAVQNPNGHIFYDIADKSLVDELYNTTGEAWMYGVDTENERIFLPRKIERYLVEKKEATDTDPTWYNLYSDGWCEQGGKYDAGSQVRTIDIDVTFNRQFLNTNFNISVTGERVSSGNASMSVGVESVTTSTMQAHIYGINTSNLCRYLHWQVEGYTETPDNLKFYEYMVVGNTNVEEAIINVTEVTTSENDTVPLWTSIYQEGEMDNVSWLRSNGQWNNGNVYLTAYNELVSKIGQTLKGGYVREITETYADYDFVLNQTDMTFRLPLKDGSENIENITSENAKAITFPYIAENNGTVIIDFLEPSASNSNMIYIEVNGEKVIGGHSYASGHYHLFTTVKKGDIINTHIDLIPKIEASAFYPSIGNGNLYFKVANAVENLELLDAGEVLETLSNKVDINSKVVDGQIIENYLILTESTTAGEYTLDLSAYLPNDGFDYEILLNCRVNNTNAAQVALSTDIITYSIAVLRTLSDGETSTNTFWLPIGAERIINYSLSGSGTSIFFLRTHAYRRIGTNI